MPRAFRTLLLLAVLLTAGLGAALPADASRTSRTPEVTDYFSRGEIERSERYRRVRYITGFTSLGLSLLTLGLLAFGAGSRRVGAFASSLSGDRWWLASLVLAAVVVVVPALVTLPLSIIRHRHDRSFGLATNTLPEFLGDVAKGLGFQLVIAAVAAVAFVGIARALPRGWPVVAAAGGALLTVALVYLFPVVYEPAFNRFEPVDGETRARILALADRAGVEVNDVLVADASRRTTRQNAYVSGIGSTRRVVLYDTLLRKSSQREVDVVVAHELAHVKHRDVLVGTLIGAAGVIAGVFVVWRLLGWAPLLGAIGARGPADPRALPFLAFFIAVAGLVTLPIANAISRHVEARADRTAIEVTQDPEAAVALEVGLARDNVADLRPHPVIVGWFFTHPPVMERIEIALEHGAR